ncbi:hypothetical protein T492DRAFT_832898 [Pavlovales sp. CCMP2436]|nr:hypothetical protein T492DRAFT_832898 [Pavlovales sp. CCMP2436]
MAPLRGEDAARELARWAAANGAFDESGLVDSAYRELMRQVPSLQGQLQLPSARAAVLKKTPSSAASDVVSDGTHIEGLGLQSWGDGDGSGGGGHEGEGTPFAEPVAVASEGASEGKGKGKGARGKQPEPYEPAGSKGGSAAGGGGQPQPYEWGADDFEDS